MHNIKDVAEYIKEPENSQPVRIEFNWERKSRVLGLVTGMYPVITTYDNVDVVKEENFTRCEREGFGRRIVHIRIYNYELLDEINLNDQPGGNDDI